MIGRADIEGSKSNVAMNAWLPQANVTTIMVEIATQPAVGETTITVVVVPITVGAEGVMAVDEVVYPNHLTRPIVVFHLRRSSHLFYTSQVISQSRTRVKLNRVFFPR
ncbi:unnamed protein product [Brassica oleracea]